MFFPRGWITITALAAAFALLGRGRGGRFLGLLGIAGSVLPLLLARGEQMPPSAPSGQAMSREEAARVLGVNEQASEAEIQAAYRRLMQRLHPDQGGNDYLASKLNEARDALLKRI